MNPWHELGLSEDARPEEIKKAYRRLAAEHHPDHNPGDEEAAERFQRVRRAYEMIKYGGPNVVHGPGVDPSYNPFPGGAGPFPGGAGPFPEDFNPFGGGGSGQRVNIRFVAPEQLQTLVVRLRRTLAVSVVLGLLGIIALGHGVRGLPWSELLWPHQLLFSFGAGLGTAFVAFIAWLFSVRVLGFMLGTALFWALILFGGLS